MSEKLALTLALGSLPTPIVPSSPASQPGMVTSNCHPGAGAGAGGGGAGDARSAAPAAALDNDRAANAPSTANLFTRAPFA